MNEALLPAELNNFTFIILLLTYNNFIILMYSLYVFYVLIIIIIIIIIIECVNVNFNCFPPD